MDINTQYPIAVLLWPETFHDNAEYPKTVFEIIEPFPLPILIPFTRISPLLESLHPVPVQRRVTHVLEAFGRREFQLEIQFHEIQNPLEVLIYPFTSSG